MPVKTRLTYNKSQYLKIFLLSTETVFANTKRDRVWPSNAIFGPRLLTGIFQNIPGKL